LLLLHQKCVILILSALKTADITAWSKKSQPAFKRCNLDFKVRRKWKHQCEV